MCESYNRQYGTHYYSVMPTNLYGPNDNYHLENSHVIPAIMRKYHLAKLAIHGDLAGIIKDEEYYGEIPMDIKDAIGLSVNSKYLLESSRNARVLLWGSGNARREFLHVDDMAAACIHIMNLDQSKVNKLTSKRPPSCSFINVGCGFDITICEVANMIKEIIGFDGETIFDTKYPDGTMQKLLDIEKMKNLQWTPQYDLHKGLQHAYGWYCNNLRASN